jgi:serine protease inhibitor
VTSWRRRRTTLPLKSIRYEVLNSLQNIFSNIFFPFKKTIEGKTGNVVISPATIQSVLTLVMYGANGQTKHELMTGLKFPRDCSSEVVADKLGAFNQKVIKTTGLEVGELLYIQSELGNETTLKFYRLNFLSHLTFVFLNRLQQTKFM